MLDIKIQPLPDFPTQNGTTDSAWPVGRNRVLFVGHDFDTPGSSFDRFDRHVGGALRRAAVVAGFEGKAEQSLVMLAPASDIERLVLIGHGEAATLDPVGMEAAGAQASRLLSGATEAQFVFEGHGSVFAAHAAYGVVSSQYRFDLYRTGEPAGHDTKRLQGVTLHVADTEACAAQWADLSAVIHGVFRARDLVTEPPNVLTPPEFARRIETLRELGVTVDILDAAAMRELGFGALLGVAQGSDQEARLAVMQWKGGQGDAQPLAFVGKGVTFDSGGISIKPAAGMDEMKTDMGGAATVVGLMEALARRRTTAHVVGLVGLVENMLSGNAQRPGDVVKSYAGTTIEVLNTDAEGRLVLADVLAYAKARFAPKFIVDLATLTGAIVVSLGYVRAGLFSNDDTLAQDLYTLGETVGEGVWRMPMGKAYDKLLKSDIADIKNITGRPGSAITAAQFLARFVGDTPWAHLDIAGVAWRSDAGPIGPKGATGFGVRLLDALVRSHETGAGRAA
ncbi:leucyl aminopeptidase [Neoasaia chiangmaiensis]|nr:leucyl aminopeptidase [Neoasaia chiangmaiensis]